MTAFSFEAMLGELRADVDDKRVEPPPGAADCDVRITAEEGKKAPEGLPEKPPEAYRELQEELGLARAVLVQPDALGFDNAILLKAREALAEAPDGMMQDCTRAFGQIRVGTEPAELEDLAAAGIDGLRLTMLRGRESCTWEEIDRHLRRTHDLTGWNAELAMDGSDLQEVEKMLRDWPGKLILADCGGFRFTRSLTQTGFRTLRRLIDRGHVWVKLAQPYAIAKDGDPADAEVTELARALLDWAPERMVWGSGWPHLYWPEEAEEEPENAVLLNLLADWAPDKALRDRVLRDNAEELYGFEPWPLAPDEG